MKKVEKVSIAEISFTLDSDAYLSLKQYLDSLHDYYDKDPDGREITRDIEARIAELILDEQVYTKVVSRPLIETIIAQLGTPEEFDDAAGETGETGEIGESPASGFSRATGTARTPGAVGAARTPGAADGSIPRRLHRSAEGKIFGGVCSGFAKFLDVSAAWVRLVFLAPLLLIILVSPFRHMHWLEEFSEGWLWVFFVTYIVLWIALPMARTPRQKLEARGERITPASIRQTMQGAATTPAGKKAASVAAELVTVLGRVVLFFVKFVMAVIGFSVLFSAIAVIITMFWLPFGIHTLTTFNGASIFSAFDGMALLSPLWFTELALLCALLPLIISGMALLSFTFSWRLGRVFYGVTLGVWAVAIIFLGVVSATNARFFRDVHERIENLQDSGHWRHDSGRHRRDRDKWRNGDADEWRSEPGRVTIREIRDSLDTADSLTIAPVAVEAKPAASSATAPASAASAAASENAPASTPPPAAAETVDRREVEIRHVE